MSLLIWKPILRSKSQPHEEMNPPAFLERWCSSFTYEIININIAKSEKDHTFEKLTFTFRTIPDSGTRNILKKIYTIYYRIHKPNEYDK